MKSIVTPRRAALGITLLLVGLTTLDALADSREDTTTRVIVQYGDLDMSKAKSAEILYRRITQAARRACDEPEHADLNEVARFRKCYDTAVSDAVNRVNEQTLTALYLTKTQRSTPG